DRHHIAVFHDLCLFGDPAVAWNHFRATLLPRQGHDSNGEIQEAVQGIDFSLNAAALLNVDDRKARHVEDIAGYHHVRAAKQYHAVAIAVGRRLTHDLNRLAVEKYVLLPPGVGLSRPRGARQWRRLAGWSAPARQHRFRGDDRGGALIAHRSRQAERISTLRHREYRHACLRELLISADMIEIRAGVDDVADWLIGQLPDRRKDAGGELGCTGVHEHDAVGTDLRGDITAGARDQIDTALHRQRGDGVSDLRLQSGNEYRGGGKSAQQRTARSSVGAPAHRAVYAYRAGSALPTSSRLSPFGSLTNTLRIVSLHSTISPLRERTRPPSALIFASNSRMWPT